VEWLKQFEDWLINYVDEGAVLWVEIFGLVLTALVLGLLVNRIFRALEVRAGRTKTVWDDAFFEACRKPAVWIIWIVGVNFAASIAARRSNSEWYDYIAQANKLAVLFLLTLFLVNFIKRAERNLVHPEYISEPLDETTVSAMGKLLRASVIITSVLIGMQLLGYSVSGVLAFGGIGGIAVGFAAKDLLANFFGGLMIYLDRPFSVGDWVRSPDREIEGTVEDIGWRLTRIRTFDKRPLYIPNSVFNTISLENPARMLNRRIYETIGVRYDDFDVVPGIVADVKAMLKAHDDIDQSQMLMVNFNKFGASSLDFFIYTFTKTTVWAEYHQIKQDVLLKIGEIIASHNAEIAFPTSTIHLADSLPEPEPEPKSSDSLETSR
jgi:MscS family membrane protein